MSTPHGRCGPCCSIAPMGSSATARSRSTSDHSSVPISAQSRGRVLRLAVLGAVCGGASPIRKRPSLLIGNKQRSTGENRGRSGTGSGSVLALVELGDHLVRELLHLHGHLRPLAQHVVLHTRNTTRTSGGTSDVSSGASLRWVCCLTAFRTPSTTGLPSSKALIFPGLTHARRARRERD